MPTREPCNTSRQVLAAVCAARRPIGADTLVEATGLNPRRVYDALVDLSGRDLVSIRDRKVQATQWGHTTARSHRMPNLYAPQPRPGRYNATGRVA